jgi:SAM-dependent methyltransferase
MFVRRLIERIFTKNPDVMPLLFCSVCGQKPTTFLALPNLYLENFRRYGFVHFENAETLSLESYTCANCGASDRERLYATWIDQEIDKGRFSEGMRVIHFAPEVALSAKLRSLKVWDYKTADLLMEHVDFKVDMMGMPFENESYDFFICSHVLEHVESDDQAIRELFRITKRGGSGILMAPIITGLAHTVEDPTVQDGEGRWKLYGQNDHVRLYAHDDFVNKIRQHGFNIKELGVCHFGAEAFRSLGLSRTSNLYVVTK